MLPRISLAFVLLLAFLMVMVAPASAQTRRVFAHFHLPYAPHGQSVEGYKRDIRDALAAGLDGFVLNMGAWDGENGNYKKKTALMFQAAREIGPGFVLLFSPDMSGNIPAEQIQDMVRTYGSHPNYFRYRGRPFLSTWSGGGVDGGGEKARDWWRDRLLAPLRAEGIDVYFVPFFYTANYHESPDYDNLLQNFSGTAKGRKGEPVAGWWKDVVDGLYYFAGVGLPRYEGAAGNSTVASGEAYARVLHENGKTFMAGGSPLYWGSLQKPGRRYYEFAGGEGLAAQWDSLIHRQKPEWIELFTWTDFTEATYLAPAVEDPAIHNFTLRTRFGKGYFTPHIGFLELNRYYVAWYKTGKQPPITEDRLYYFYRTHPADAVAPDDPLGPVTTRHGGAPDVLFVTTMLTRPAELRVEIGGTVRTAAVKAGIAHTRIPFQPGTPVFELRRNGEPLLRRTGERIESDPVRYNFSFTSGYAGSLPRPDLTVADISTEPANPLPGDAVTLRATIRNGGNAAVPAGGAAVRFYVDGTPFATPVQSTALRPGASVTVAAKETWSATAGAHRVEAWVESSASEADPYNNLNRLTIAVGPTLSIEHRAASAETNLTSLGTRDWVHWGEPDTIVRKRGGTGEIGPLESLGGAAERIGSGPAAYIWTDGPESGAGRSAAGLSRSGAGGGFRLSVPADTSPRTLSVCVGGASGAGRLSASLSGGGAPPYVEGYDIYANPAGPYRAVYALTYRAASPGQTLTVEWKPSADSGSVTFHAAALSDAPQMRCIPEAKSAGSDGKHGRPKE